ncbi:MAG: response regulator [candidate division NC10 bacterium]|nr:response regulator [candidate division NC10 bacterium]
MMRVSTALKSVLVVDNDRFFREALGELLEQQGYRVRKAMDGLQALEQVEMEPPDFILLDLIKPMVDGVRLCRYLREDPRFHEAPIIVFSGLAARDITGMPDLEVDAYVAKGPLDLVVENILAALRHLEANGRNAPLHQAVFGYEGFRPRQLVTELLAWKRHHELLLWNMSEGVLEADEEGRIVYANPSALQMLEKNEKDLIGTRLASAFDAQARAEVEGIVKHLLAAREPEKRFLVTENDGRRLKLSFSSIRGRADEAGLLVLLEMVGHIQPG